MNANISLFQVNLQVLIFDRTSFIDNLQRNKLKITQTNLKCIAIASKNGHTHPFTLKQKPLKMKIFTWRKHDKEK
jgi:hypothetical protein